MIKKFNDFFCNLNESAIGDVDGNNMIIDNYTMEYLDKHAPEFVYDDKYFAKISRIVCREIEKKAGIKTSIYPFMIEIDGEKASMINVGMNYAVVCFRDGIRKKISLFKGSELDNNTHDTLITATSNKLGFKGAIEAIIDYLTFTVGENKKTVNEAIDMTNRGANNAIPDKTLKKIRTLNPELAFKFAKLMEVVGSETELQKMFDNVKLPYDENDYSIVTQIHKVFFDGQKKSSSVYARMITAMRLVYNGMLTDFSNVDFFGICDTNGNITGADIEINTDEYAGMGADVSPNTGNAVGLSESSSVTIRNRADVLEEKVQDLEYRMNHLKKLTDAIGILLKSNGKDARAYKRNFGEARGLLVTGLGGIGKSYNLNKTIEEMSLSEYRDYYKVGNSTTGSNEMYNILYQNSENLVVFDDTPDLFDSEAKASLWKRALETKENDRTVVRPEGVIKNHQKSEVYYSVGSSDRQERYFKEVGKKTPQEKKEYLKKAIESLRKEYTIRDPETGEDTCPYDQTTLENMAKKKWIEEENKALPLIPDKFTFNGIVMIITNLTFDDFCKSGGSHWAAIQSRFITLQIEPSYTTVWAWLKNKIIAAKDNQNIPEKNKLIPTKFVDVFIDYIDEIMTGKFNRGANNIFGAIDFRRLSNMKTMMENAYDNETFEDFKAEFLEMMRHKPIQR